MRMARQLLKKAVNATDETKALTAVYTYAGAIAIFCYDTQKNPTTNTPTNINTK